MARKRCEALFRRVSRNTADQGGRRNQKRSGLGSMSILGSSPTKRCEVSGNSPNNKKPPSKRREVKMMFDLLWDQLIQGQPAVLVELLLCKLYKLSLFMTQQR
jgi:hypothetical protein